MRVDLISNSNATQEAGTSLPAASAPSESFSDALARSSQTQSGEPPAGESQSMQVKSAQAGSAAAQCSGAKSLQDRPLPGGPLQPPSSGIVSQFSKVALKLKGQATATIGAKANTSAASLDAKVNGNVKTNAKQAARMTDLSTASMTNTVPSNLAVSALQDVPVVASFVLPGMFTVPLPAAAMPSSDAQASASNGSGTEPVSPSAAAVSTAGRDPSGLGMSAGASPVPAFLSGFPSSATVADPHVAASSLQEPSLNLREWSVNEFAVSTGSTFEGNVPHNESAKLPAAPATSSAPPPVSKGHAASVFSLPDAVPSASDSPNRSIPQPFSTDSDGAALRSIVSTKEEAVADNNVHNADNALPLNTQQVSQLVLGDATHLYSDPASPTIALPVASDATVLSSATGAPLPAVASLTTQDSLSIAQSLLPQFHSVLNSAMPAAAVSPSVSRAQASASAPPAAKPPEIARSTAASPAFSIRGTALAPSIRETMGDSPLPPAQDMRALTQRDDSAIPLATSESSAGPNADPVPNVSTAAASANPAVELARPDTGYSPSTESDSSPVQPVSSSAVPALTLGQKLPTASRAAAGTTTSASTTASAAAQGTTSDAASPALVTPPMVDASVPAATPDKANSATELPPAHQMLDSAPLGASDPMPVASSGAHLAPEGAAVQLQIGVHTSAFGNVEVHTVIEQSQVGIAIHGDRDLTRWFNSEIGGIETGLKAQHLNLTGVDFSSTRSGVQTATSFQHGQPRQNSPQTAGTYAASPANPSAADAANESDSAAAFLAQKPETRVSILV
ncbi:MAG: hypothetical protein WAL71_20020 [Terriglobales bacterium]